MTSVAVLGAGRIGKTIAADLARDGEFQVTVTDRSAEALASVEQLEGVTTRQADLSRGVAVSAAVAEHDLVVGALPGFMGYGALRSCLEAGKDVVDISFFPEDAQELDRLAQAHGARCLVDFGVAPGCSNLLFGHVQATLARVDSFVCYVGGLPAERRWPWEYIAPFSPVDVLEEYTRPARFISGGQVVTRPALSEPELVQIPGLGTLEAFVTDGLRSLLRVEGVQTLVEKTCRYPGHRDRIAALLDSGFLDPEPRQLAGGARVSPLELTSQLLFEAWAERPEDEDLTAMLVLASGEDAQGEPVQERWDLLDRYDRLTHQSSMARTTGFTCTAGVRLLSRGLWQQAGVAPPEAVGRDVRCFDFVMGQLQRRHVRFRQS